MARKRVANRSSARKTSARRNKPARPLTTKQLIRKYAVQMAVAFVAAIGVFVGVFVLLIQFIPFDTSKLSANSSPTVVYARDGSTFMTISASGASGLPYQNIPRDLQNAVVATEDHRFWVSSSIDMRGILRAAFVDLWRQRLAQGGSTIQEQLAKIVYLNDQKTFGRKLQQIVLGVQINRHYTKQEILAMYLNNVFLGENCVGAQRAAERYFGIDLLHHPEALTLPQAALLAGLPQAPTTYDPIMHPHASLIRRNQVLENMVKFGYITRAKADWAERQPLGVSFHSLTDDAWDTQPLFTQFLLDYADRNHIPREELLHGGLKVYTTVDPQVQNAVNRVFWNNDYPGVFPAPVGGKPVQGAAVFVDPSTGGILGAAGSRQDGFYRDGLDRVYSNSSPGSSIKPVMEYAPAIESGNYSPSTVLNNTPRDFGGGYIPRNDPGAPASCTLHYALETSQNVASVSLLQQIGIQTGADFAANDGINLTTGDRQHLGIAIGGLELGVNPLQMAQAYEPFADGGVQEQAHLITRIVNQAGQTIYNYQPAAKRIMSANTAVVMTGLMQDVVRYGTGVSAQIPGWDVAGKTGTVQFDSALTGFHPDWVRNVWFDGYTPSMVGSVYLGYDNRSDQYHLNWYPYPGAYAAQIFSQIVSLAVSGQPGQHFNTALGPAPQPTAQPAPHKPAPQVPVSGLTASWDATGYGVQLAWQSQGTGNWTYVIDRLDQGTAGQSANGGQSQGVLETIGQTSQLSFEDQNVTPGATYTYMVQAMDASTGSAVGSAASIRFTVPGATGVTPGTPGQGQDGSQGGQGNNAGLPPGSDGTGGTGGGNPGQGDGSQGNPNAGGGNSWPSTSNGAGTGNATKPAQAPATGDVNPTTGDANPAAQGNPPVAGMTANTGN